MGGASQFDPDRQIKARNTRTGKLVALQVWRMPPPPGKLYGVEHVCRPGDAAMTTLSKGRYLDSAGDEWVSDDADAP